MSYRVNMLVVGIVGVMLLAGTGCAAETTPPEEEGVPTEEEEAVEEQAPAEPEEQVFEWRLQSTKPPTDIGQIIARPAFLDNVRAATNGRLDIKMFNAGELVASAELTDAIEQGMVDVGQTWGAYHLGVHPLGNIQGGLEVMPFVLESATDYELLHYKLGWDDMLREEYAESNMYYLGFELHGAVGIWSREEVSGLEDMDGFKPRIGSAIISRVFEKFGAAPVFIPHAEVYTSLASGAIDGSSAGIEVYRDQSYYEVCPYFYVPYIAPACTSEWLVNMDKWNALPDDIRQILASCMREHQRNMYLVLQMEHDKMFDQFDEWGTTIVRFSDEDVSQLRQTSISFLPELAALSPRMAEASRIFEDYAKRKGYIA